MATALRRRIGLIGEHPEHSLSPRAWNAYFQRAGIDADYVPLPTDGASLAATVDTLRSAAWIGANVTMPHKRAALDLVDEVSSDASSIGATSWVVRDPNGRLVGHNTDAMAARSLLRDRIVDRVLAIGVGGVGRAVAEALFGRITSVVIVDQDPTAARLCASRARALGLRASVEPLASLAAPGPCDLVVNATPLGMADDDRMPLDPSTLSADTIVYDLVYRADGPTPLHRAAEEAGLEVIPGIAHLTEQAVAMLASAGLDPSTAPDLRECFQVAFHEHGSERAGGAS